VEKHRQLEAATKKAKKRPGSAGDDVGVELNLSFLKKGGILGMVAPD
jgi:hypothetical protein